MLPGLLRESRPEQFIFRGSQRLDTWPTLLVVDSDVQMIQALVCFFEKRGFHVAACQSLAEAKEFFYRRRTWSLVIADYHLPDGTGSELCTWIHEQSHETPFLMMSGSPHFSALATEADFLPKPFSLETLETYVRTIVRSR